MDDLRESIVQFVLDHSGADRQTLDPDDLLGSTGLEGDDALALMDGFADRFGVDMCDYRPDLHHWSDADMASPDPQDDRVRVAIGVDELVLSATHGRWMVDYSKVAPEPLLMSATFNAAMVAGAVIVVGAGLFVLLF